VKKSLEMAVRRGNVKYVGATWQTWIRRDGWKPVTSAQAKELDAAIKSGDFDVAPDGVVRFR
jgi:hypothetical protein